MTDPSHHGLAAAERALARSRAYDLLGALLVRGADPALVDRAAAVEPLADALPRPPPRPPVVDELAGLHHAMFGLEVFPHAGVYLHPSRSVGAVADELLADYREAGFSIDPRSASGDHLGCQLAFLAYLTAVEAGAADDLERVRELQRRALDRHLLPWLPPLLAAVAAQPRSLWTTVCELAAELAADHRAEFGDPVAARELPAPRDILADADTGVAQIVDYLITPCHGGVFLSRSDIATLARPHALPRGFGSRAHTLGNVLRAAAEYDRVPALMAEISDLLDRRTQHAQALAQDPVWAAHVAPWQRRIAGTRSILERIANRLATR